MFVTGDSHLLSVNNLTYQDHFGGPQIASSAFQVVVLSLGGFLFEPATPPVAAALGLITPAQLPFYKRARHRQHPSRQGRFCRVHH